MIHSTDKYIVSFQEEFKIYNKNTLALIKTVKESKVKLFQLFRDFIVFSDENGVFLYCIQKELKIDVAVSSMKVNSLFIKDSFIYIGYENGTLNVYNYNEHLAKLTKTYKHPGPIRSLVSDNIKVYVSDLRNKITVYPDQISYDFIEPKMFFKVYPYTLSENKLYAHTQDNTGFLFEFMSQTESIQFSPSGGTVFALSNGFVCIYDTLGNQLGKFMASDFTVIENNGKCLIIEEVDNKLSAQETYVRDLEAPEFNFPKTEIQKKALSVEDYEQKYVFVDDGNKKSIKKIKKPINNRKNTSESEDDESYHADRRRHSFISESDEESGSYDPYPQPTNTFFNPVLVTKNPSSYENTEGHLLFYSSQGFMISLESAVSNQIFVKFHDRSFDSYEIKDTLKCKLGSFIGGNYVISDGKTINFSGIWSKEISCSLLGLNDTYIYAFDQGILNIIDYLGNIIDTYYIKDAYSFCASNNSLAVFCKDFLMLMSHGKAEYIPCSDIEFGCFDNDQLFLKIGLRLFTVSKNLLKAVCELKERPLTVYDNNVVILAENILLPRPVVKFQPIKPEIIEQVSFESYSIGRYDPSRR